MLEGAVPDDALRDFNQVLANMQLAYAAAVEALQALLPVLEGAVADEVVRDFNQVLANMQLAYASAAAEDSTAEH